MLRDYAPRSIIPQHKVFKPKKVEIWVFDKCLNLLRSYDQMGDDSYGDEDEDSQNSADSFSYDESEMKSSTQN